MVVVVDLLCFAGFDTLSVVPTLAVLLRKPFQRLSWLTEMP